MKDKAILITGGAQRIGAQIARALHAEGMRVILHYRHSENAAQSLAQELNHIRPKSAATVQGDLTQTDSYSQIIKNSYDMFGRLDGLINNASTFYPTQLGETTLEQWDELMRSNLQAPFFLSQAAANYLRKSRGVIINLTDIHADRPMKNHSVYCIAKAGLVMLTKSLAKELSPEIRVNAVAPGPVLWPEDMDNNLQKDLVERTALKTPGSAEDIAKAVLFLVKDAPYVTGQSLIVDGGRSLNQ